MIKLLYAAYSHARVVPKETWQYAHQCSEERCSGTLPRRSARVGRVYMLTWSGTFSNLNDSDEPAHPSPPSPRQTYVTGCASARGHDTRTHAPVLPPSS